MRLLCQEEEVEEWADGGLRSCAGMSGELTGMNFKACEPQGLHLITWPV